MVSGRFASGPAGAIQLGQEWLVKHVQDGADLERVSYIAGPAP